MSAPFEAAAVSLPGSGQPSRAFGRRTFRITAAETGGAMSVWDEPVAPGDGPPLHVYHREDEMFRVLEGRFHFWCGGQDFEAGPGACMVLPRGVPHRFQNVGDREGLLTIVLTPGGLEGFFVEVERQPPSTPEEVAALAARYGVEFPPSQG